MVLGVTQRTSGFQYSLKTELWHPDRLGMTECQKSPLKELWLSERDEYSAKPVFVVVSGDCVAALVGSGCQKYRRPSGCHICDTGNGRGGINPCGFQTGQRARSFVCVFQKSKIKTTAAAAHQGRSRQSGALYIAVCPEKSKKNQGGGSTQCHGYGEPMRQRNRESQKRMS